MIDPFSYALGFVVAMVGSFIGRMIYIWIEVRRYGR